MITRENFTIHPDALPPHVKEKDIKLTVCGKKVPSKLEVLRDNLT